MYISCTDTQTKNTISNPVDVYQYNNKYTPNVGYKTGITVTGVNSDNSSFQYTVLSYNQPFTYDREYYMYLPYEYDPIANIVYVFSV